MISSLLRNMGLLWNLELTVSNRYSIVILQHPRPGIKEGIKKHMNV